MDTTITIERVPFESLGDEWHELARAGYHADYAGISEMYGGGAATAEAKIALMHRWGGGILAWTARDASGGLVGLLTGDVDGEELTIYDFFVDAACRRRGVGRALVGAALAEPGVCVAAAEVNAGNAASLALFEALGFAPVRTVLWVARRLDGEDGAP